MTMTSNSNTEIWPKMHWILSSLLLFFTIPLMQTKPSRNPLLLAVLLVVRTVKSRESIWSNSAELHTCYEAREFYLLLLFPISLTIALIFSAEVLYVIFSNKLKSSAWNSFSSKGPSTLDREKKH